MNLHGLIHNYIERVSDKSVHTLDINSVIQSIRQLISFLLPGRFSPISNIVESNHEEIIACAVSNLEEEIKKTKQSLDKEAFYQSYSKLFDIAELDIKAVLKNDPAAKSSTEIITAYPGILAVTAYRLAHVLHQLKISLIPRIITEWAHQETGIDIHFGAQIGNSFFIDHGSGVVIGETTVIGDNVTIYQGVTLGSKNFPIDEEGTVIKGLKRHPTIGNNVTVYANATILGGDTIIGDDVTVAGNLFITKSIQKNSIALFKGIYPKK